MHSKSDITRQSCRLCFFCSRYWPSPNYYPGYKYTHCPDHNLSKANVKSNLVLICDMICRRILYNCEMWCNRELYAPYRFTTGVSGWIVIWRNSQELFVFIYSLQKQGWTTGCPTTLEWQFWNRNVHTMVKSFRNTLCRNYQSTMGRPCRSW